MDKNSSNFPYQIYKPQHCEIGIEVTTSPIKYHNYHRKLIFGSYVAQITEVKFGIFSKPSTGHCPCEVTIVELPVANVFVHLLRL